jgi:hypothetical protein
MRDGFQLHEFDESIVLGLMGMTDMALSEEENIFLQRMRAAAELLVNVQITRAAAELLVNMCA